MSLYESMFAQYGLRTAQVLVTKPDMYHEASRKNLTSTLNELLRLNIIPIVNTNDAVAPPPERDLDLSGVRFIQDILGLVCTHYTHTVKLLNEIFCHQAVAANSQIISSALFPMSPYETKVEI